MYEIQSMTHLHELTPELSLTLPFFNMFSNVLVRRCKISLNITNAIKGNLKTLK